MKTLKTLTLSLVILATFGTAKAVNLKTDNEVLTIDHAVATYINALTHGQLSDLSAVIDQNAKFTMLRGKTMLSFSKADIINSVKDNENLEQQCATSTSITESNSDLSIVKIDMKYATFTYTSYVTLTNTSDGWKITNVYFVFK
jgi:hypothetical protein